MHNYLRLLPYIRRRRTSLLLIAVLTLGASGLAALQPWPLKLLIDHALGSAPLDGPVEAAFRAVSLSPTTGTIVAAAVIGGLLLFTLNALVDGGLAWAWTFAGRRMVIDLAEDLYAKSQRRSLLYHQRTPVADVMGRITTDSWCVYQMVDALLFTPAYAALTLGLMIILMLRLDPALTWVALAIAPISVAASFLLGKPLRSTAASKRTIEITLQAHILQTLAGIPVVQAFAQEARESARFRGLASGVIRAQQRGALLGSFNNLSSGLAAAAGAAVVMWAGARHVLEGKLSVGGMLVFIAYLGTLQAQTRILAGIYSKLQNLAASSTRVLEQLDAPLEIRERPGAIEMSEPRGEVTFADVTTGYEPDRPVLKNISFTALPGQTVAIVGATGAGKTTLVNLIPRFADPWEGRVLVDGYDVRDVRIESLRSRIGLVLQEAYLLPVSVAENIAYGKPGAGRQEIEAAARAANAHDFITALPSGYDTILGECGMTLSGGERQRLAIARAWLRNPRILVLDEPTSALDAVTEHLIMEALKRVAAGRTTFIIAHRLSTIRRADSIHVLENGRLVESGTHQELLDLKGRYARLCALQTRGVNPAEEEF